MIKLVLWLTRAAKNPRQSTGAGLSNSGQSALSECQHSSPSTPERFSRPRAKHSDRRRIAWVGVLCTRIIEVGFSWMEKSFEIGLRGSEIRGSCLLKSTRKKHDPYSTFNRKPK